MTFARGRMTFNDQAFGMELRALRKHLPQHGERALDESLAAHVVTRESVGQRPQSTQSAIETSRPANPKTPFTFATTALRVEAEQVDFF
jgi:hypothetical protein